MLSTLSLPGPSSVFCLATGHFSAPFFAPSSRNQALSNQGKPPLLLISPGCLGPPYLSPLLSPRNIRIDKPLLCLPRFPFSDVPCRDPYQLSHFNQYRPRLVKLYLREKL